MAELRDTDEGLRSLIEGLVPLVWTSRDGGLWTWASPQWSALTGLTLEQSLGEGWLDALHPHDRDLARESWVEADRSGRLHMEVRIFSVADGRHRWFQTRAQPIPRHGPGAREWIGACTDIDELRRLQVRQALILRDLQHRVRNLLATFRSIVTRTGQTSMTVEDFASHLDGRLDALTRVQLVLTRAPSDSVDLEALVREELLAQAAERQVEIDGVEARLPPRTAEVLALVIHELATNAVKFGALSAGHGRVAISWTVQEAEPGRRLRFVWRETGVRVASAAPRRQGFGSEMIEQRLAYELQGEGELQFRPGGVVCTLDIPLPDVAPPSAAENAGEPEGAPHDASA